MSKRLSSLLVEDGRVSSQRITDAIERQAINGGCLDSSLLELKAIDEDLLIQYLKRATQLPALPHGIHGVHLKGVTAKGEAFDPRDR